VHPLITAVAIAAATVQLSPVHGKDYWRAIAAAKFEVPAGATAQQLAPELLSSLGSPDPELRDDLAFSILTSWIYQKKLLGPEDLRPMIRALEGNLRKGIGETGTDDVLLRSFSALTLSVIAARDNDAPFPPFGQGEDERMARVAISIVRRADFDRDGFRSWLAAAQGAAKFPNPATADALRAEQNVRHLLTSLWTELSVDDRPSEGADFAKTALRDALKALF
jgi:hypothetical protein